MEYIVNGNEVKVTERFLTWHKRHGGENPDCLRVGDSLFVISVEKEPEYNKHVVNLCADKTGSGVNYFGVPMKVVRKMRKAFLPPIVQPTKSLPSDIHDGTDDPEAEIFDASQDDF